MKTKRGEERRRWVYQLEEGRREGEGLLPSAMAALVCAADEGDGSRELCKELVVSNEASAADEETIRVAAAARRAVLNECEEMSCSDTRAQGQAALRPVSAADFSDARLEVTTSVNADSHAMTELRQWNLKFGEGDRSGYRDTALSYFM